MISFGRLTEILLYSMLFAPLFSYITLGVMGLFSILYVYIVIVNVYGIIYLFNYKNKIRIPTFNYFWLAWILYLIVWTFFNGSIEQDGVMAFLKRSREFAIFFIIVIIYNTDFRERFINNSVLLFKFTVLIALLFSIIQVFDSSFFNAWNYWRDDLGYSGTILGNIYQVRRTSIFGFINLNAVGLSFIPMLSLLIGYLLYTNKRGFLLFLLMGGMIAILTNTRYVMIGFILIAFQYIFYKKNILLSSLKYMIILAIVALIIVQSLMLLDYDLIQYFKVRLFSEGEITETTRYAAILNFLEFFPKYPLLGNGDIYAPEVVAASNLYGSSHIHVGYLSHLVAYGIFGCSLLFTFWLLIVRKFYRTARLTGYWGSLFGFLAFLWAFATFSQSSIFYTGLIYTIVFDKYYQDKINNV